MAISLVGTDTTFEVWNTSLTLTLPAHSQGDALIAVINVNHGSDTINSVPSGWSEIGSGYDTGANWNYCFYKQAGASESNPTWGMSTSLSCRGGLIVLTGVDTSSCFGDSGATNDTAWTTTLTAPSVTIDTSGNVAVHLGGFRSSTATTTPPGGTPTYSEVVDESGSYSGVCISWASYTSPVATGAKTATISAGVPHTGFHIEVLAAGIGGTTVDCTTDALILTENSPVLGLDVSAGVDTLTVTENVSTVSKGYDISVGVDALTVTENAATIALDLDISVGVDVLTLTENSATVGGTTEVSAGVDVLTLTENSVVVGENVSAGIDTLALTENSAAVTLDLNVSANVDALTLVENSATISEAIEVLAGIDALTVTENAVAVTLGLEISVGVDSLSVTTYQAIVVAGALNIEASTDALTLTENSAVIGLDVTAGVDALTLTENVVTVGLNADINATLDALSVSLFNPVIGLDVQSGVDALTLAEYIAVITAAIGFTVSTARTYNVSAENREYDIGAENREYDVASETRLYNIPSEDRTYTG